MSSATQALCIWEAPPLPSLGLKRFALALTWVAFAVGGIVFFEPAPFDALMLVLIWLLPLVRLAPTHRLLLLLLLAWLVVVAAGLVGAAQADDPARAVKHIFITLYLAVAAFVIAGFVRSDPERHLRIILSGWTFAAAVAASAGIIGYFALLPGAEALFTEFGRARGTFKDPNVFGPFLVPPLLYAMHRIMSRPLHKAIGPLLLTGLFAFALLISFSRGAWFNAAVAVLAFGFLALVTAPSNRRRIRFLFLGLFSLLIAFWVIMWSAQIGQVNSLLQERAGLALDYDLSEDGRFSGQRRAVDAVLEHPLGIGALEFNDRFHDEDPHNVYLSMFLNSGWVGGFAYLGLIALTLILGFQHVLRDLPGRAYFAIVYAAFLGCVLEGLVIDTDHWRQFYVLMGALWGMMSLAPWGSRSPDAPKLLLLPPPSAGQSPAGPAVPAPAE